MESRDIGESNDDGNVLLLVDESVENILRDCVGISYLESFSLCSRSAKYWLIWNRTIEKKRLRASQRSCTG